MKKSNGAPRSVLLTLMLFAFACRAGAAEPSAQEILAASDRIRNPDKPFALTTLLTEYRNGSQTNANTLLSYAKEEKSGGQYQTLVRFLSPARDVNKLMLRNGNELWFYDPASNASVRVSPQQRLLGQAANGDVVTVNLAKDYRAQFLGDEDALDGEKQNRHCHKLALTASSDSVTYHHIDMWIEAGTNRPVKARFYTESDRLLKTAFYRRYQAELGVERPTETVIIDGLDPKWVTVMRYSDYAYRDIPDSWMQRDYLQHFKPD